MPKYTVTVIRTSYASRDIEVEAENEILAKEMAMDESGNHLYSEHNADYAVEDIFENK
jgi:hypothetical protein